MNPKALLLALRPHQWTKNLFVLAALLFALGDRQMADLVDRAAVLRTLWAFGAFCLGASAMYVLNDVRDVESDRAHPTKRGRPVASGAVTVREALVLGLACGSGALAMGWLAGGEPRVIWVLLGYVAMNVAYSLKLKHVVLIDVFCIATGFVLRVVAGGLASGTETSHWLLLCTLFLALFLALNKRRAEINLLGEDGVGHRRTLGEYPPGFLDQMVVVLAACTIVCYTMYTVDDRTMERFGEDNHLVWTVPFVVFGIARYQLLVQTNRGGGSPTRVLLGGDPLFLLNGLAWLAVVASALFSDGASG